MKYDHIFYGPCTFIRDISSTCCEVYLDSCGWTMFVNKDNLLTLGEAYTNDIVPNAVSF